MLNSSEAVMEKIVNSFTDADGLIEFGAAWGLQDSVATRFRFFQLTHSMRTHL